MKIAKSPYQSLQISQYWIGVTTKKTQSKVRWSPCRVGVRVMNSRSARNEISAKSSTAPAPRIKTAIAKTAP